MRAKSSWVFLLGALLATMAAAQTKISGTMHCGKPDPWYKVDAADRPGHAFALWQSACTWPKPIEMGGTSMKENVSVTTGETSGNKGSERGFDVGTMASGDKVFVRFQGASTLKDGAPQSIEGTFSFAGGTGKMKGLKGKGMYKGKPDADGSVTFEIEGEYQLP